MQYSFLSGPRTRARGPAWNSLLRIGLVEAVSSALASPPARQERLGLALSSIARTLAESLELKVVFSRVAEAVRQVVPFDVMGVRGVPDLDVPWEGLGDLTL